MLEWGNTLVVYLDFYRLQGVVTLPRATAVLPHLRHYLLSESLWRLLLSHDVNADSEAFLNPPSDKQINTEALAPDKR